MRNLSDQVQASMTKAANARAVEKMSTLVSVWRLLPALLLVVLLTAAKQPSNCAKRSTQRANKTIAFFLRRRIG